jgi:hypothetical protein
MTSPRQESSHCSSSGLSRTGVGVDSRIVSVGCLHSVAAAATVWEPSAATHRLMDATTAFDRRLKHVPDPWKRHLIEVIDTFENVQIGLKSIGIDDSFVLIEAARMVIERRDKELASMVEQFKSEKP